MQKQTDKMNKNASTVVVPSVYHLEGGEQTEITAQISVPEEGGWGWVVMVTSFLSILIMDGVVFSFGALFTDIRDDMQIEESLVALVNSVAFGVYFTAGPVASAVINRFGFRECTMAGSVISSIALLLTYFASNYAMLFMFLGILNGFGAALVAMSSNLVVGFYFERLRSLVMAVAGSGASAGIMILYFVNSHMTSAAGWRVTTLFHAGLCGIIYFLGMTYRPLLSLFVTKTTDENIPTVTYLPNLSQKNIADKKTTAAERLLQTVSNPRFPTAAAVVKEGIVVTAVDPDAGPSTPLSKTHSTRLSITVHNPSAIHNQKQFKSLQSLATAPSNQANKQKPAEVSIAVETPKKKGCWATCCHWERSIPESRPMYRDDAFYAGDVEQLPVYKKSMADISPESRTGLEYQMAVTRAATAADMSEKRGIFTTAFRRVFVTMMDPTLLRKSSFLLLCFSGFCTYSGFLVPYIFLEERNKFEGIDPNLCTMLVSAIGFANLVGRLLLGIMACKLDPIKIYLTACIVSGISLIASNFSFNVYYQYACGLSFGFFIASLVSLRSMVLVKLYGIDMLTNATGVMVVFQGIGGLISTPLGSIFKSIFGFAGPFYLAGTFILTSGLVLFPVKMLADREAKTEEKKSSEKPDDKPRQVDKPATRPGKPVTPREKLISERPSKASGGITDVIKEKGLQISSHIGERNDI